MGQTRQELPGGSGGIIGVHCTCCGEPPAGTAPVTAVLREIVYEYCDDDCRDRHADVVRSSSPGCEMCHLDAVGDTGRCAFHLDDAEASDAGRYPLAS